MSYLPLLFGSPRSPRKVGAPLSYHASVLAKKRYSTPIVPCFCPGQKEVQYPYRTMLLSWPKRGTIPLSYHASVLAKKRYSTPISYNAPLYTWFCPCYCELAPFSVYDGVYYIPLGRFSMVDVSTVVGIVSEPKMVGVRNISSRAFRRHIVRYWHPLGCRAIGLAKPPQGGVMYTVVYGRRFTIPHLSLVWSLYTSRPQKVTDYT